MAAASLIPTVLDAVVAGLRAYSTGDVTFRSPMSSASGVAKEIKMANGRPALKGKCPVCGTGMFKILAPK